MKKRVLLVDDEPEICFLLTNMLRRVGVDCSEANSLPQAREALNNGTFDVVFLDIHLSDGLGYELIPDVRKDSPDARCIAISAVDAERGKAVQAGADGFISKPFTQAEILSSLGSLNYPATNNPH